MSKGLNLLNIVNLLLFFFSGSFVVFSALEIKKLLQSFSQPSFAAFFICLFYYNYIFLLIPGSFGVYTPFFITISFLLGMLFLNQLNKYFFSQNVQVFHCEYKKPSRKKPITKGDVLIVTPALFFLLFKLKFFFSIPLKLFMPYQGIFCDPALYHFPAVVEIVQNQSWWTLENPYQSYFLGFEILGGISGPFLHTHWSFVPFNALCVFFFLGIMYEFAEFLCNECFSEQTVHPCAVYILFLGLWFPWFYNQLYFFGKNDIFLTNCQVASLLMALQSRSWFVKKQSTMSESAFWLSITGFSLSLSVKHSSFGYLPFLMVFLFLSLIWGSVMSFSKPKIGGVVITILLPGLFFLFRNIFLLQALISKEFVNTWKTTLFFHFQHYNWSAPSSWVFLASLLFPLLIIFMIKFSKRENVNVLLWLAFFLSLGAASFFFCPYVIFFSDFQIRLGMTYFSLVFLIFACSIILLKNSFCERFNILKKQLPFGNFSLTPYFSLWLNKKTICLAIGFLFLSLVYWLGFPSYSGINLPKTSLLKLVEEKKISGRILAYGFFPYGLYGPEWRNKVRAELVTSNLLPTNDGIETLKNDLISFKPDFVFFSPDITYPHILTILNDLPKDFYMIGQEKDGELKKIERFIETTKIFPILENFQKGDIKKINLFFKEGNVFGFKVNYIPSSAGELKNDFQENKKNP